MFEDTRLKIFKTVAQEGSFTNAARKLGISQPAVSQNIAELEKELGTTVFERARGSVKLTDEGTRFMEYADQINYWYNAASEAFKARPLIPESPQKEKKHIYVGVHSDYICHMVPEDSEKAAIILSKRNERLSITIEQKTAESE